jgi:glucose/arabinose dehydrogenase
MFVEVTGGLSNPVFVTHAGDGTGRMFVLERSGRIRVIKNGSLLSTPFLDIQSIVKSSSGEQGLLGLAFHPLYESNGRFYVVYTAPRPGDANGSILTLRQFSVSAGNPDLADPASGATLLTIDHPTYSNHNGGTLAFGNDGYLYWSTGDGGGGGDPNENGQDLTRLLGKILRLDVDSATPYAVPASNPFYSNPNPNTKLIWAYGLRNPWRMSFDRGTHDLYIGDVGQGLREEINFQPASSSGGENYGWDVMEGSLCYEPSAGCDQSGKVLPVVEYDHSLGNCSVTGGYVYRRSSFASLTGHYLYGDFCSGRIYSIYRTSPAAWSAALQLADTSFNITTFGEDESGELYLADYASGKIYKIRYQELFYTINGNAGVGGAVLQYTDGGPKSVTSDGVGNYSITVPSGWSGTVTPYKSGYQFTPAGRNYSNIQGNQIGQNYTAQICVGCADVDVILSREPMGSYTIASETSMINSYPKLMNGPVKVVSTTGEDIFVSQRSIALGGLTEVMGYPSNKLSTEYWFTWYDWRSANVATWILVGNPDTAQTAYVDIFIGGTFKETLTIPPGENRIPYYVGLMGGPVKVVSKSVGGNEAVPVYASERTAVYNSFNEVTGYPKEDFATEYWYPWYDWASANVVTWILVGNPDTAQTAYVDIFIGGTFKETLMIPPGENKVPYYPGTIGGPVKVMSKSVGGNPAVKIFTSERTVVGNTFNEVMGYPNTQFHTKYWYPWYDGQNMVTWILVGNPSETDAVEVEIYIAGVLQHSETIPAKQSIAPTFNVSNGPLEVRCTSCTGDQKIFTSERIIYGAGTLNSFNETFGVPDNRLSDKYYFTWYDSYGMQSYIITGKP